MGTPTTGHTVESIAHYEINAAKYAVYFAKPSSVLVPTLAFNHCCNFESEIKQGKESFAGCSGSGELLYIVYGLDQAV